MKCERLSYDNSYNVKVQISIKLTVLPYKCRLIVLFFFLIENVNLHGLAYEKLYDSVYRDTVDLIFRVTMAKNKETCKSECLGNR